MSKMQPSGKKTSWLRSPTLIIFVPMIIGLHIGWFTFQQNYVPVEERHDHILVKLYKKYTT